MNMYDQDSGAPINPPPGYSSKTAYSFPLEQVEAITRISACPRKNMAAKVITLPRRRRAKTSKRFKFRGPTATLGELEKLPVELLNEVCMHMSILSLSRFGQVNLRARQIVNSLREYRIATLHSLDVLEALATTRTASHITMSDYHRLLCERNCHLCERNCHLCGDHGNYVHLLNWIRCCWRCLAGLPPRRRMGEDRIPAALQVTTASAAEHILNPRPTTFNKIPQLSSLPGRYGLYQVQRKGRKDLVSVQSVIAALESDDAKVEELRRRLDMADEARTLACMSCFPMPSYDDKSGTVQQGVACAGCGTANNQLLSRKIHVVNPWRIVTDVMFSHQTFLEHFKWCDKAQELWESSKNGTEEPPDVQALAGMVQVDGLARNWYVTASSAVVL